ncbi:putative cinnamoyl-CoA reductase [Xylaria castorea]|nr:putative cinnamoyl-CoA reductase [Xylaria castorea]
MSKPTNRRVIVVLGATSAQGSGVVAALLHNPKGQWAIRAVTRDTTSPWAEKFRSKYQAAEDRVSLVSGNVYDVDSLRFIFSGAYGVFAMINEVLPGKPLVLPEEIRHQVTAGKDIVDTTKQCGLKHFVMSSLPDMVKASSGRFTEIYHMDHKFEIEQYAKKQLDCVTCVLPGIFDLGGEKTAGKNYPVLSPLISMDDMAATFTRITGRKAIHSPLTHDEWADLTAAMLGPAFREDVKQMIEWVSVAPTDKICYGALDPEEDISAKELGVTTSTFEDWMKRTGWTGPTEVYKAAV